MSNDRDPEGVDADTPEATERTGERSKLLLSTTDAQVWAREFCKLFSPIPTKNGYPDDVSAHGWAEGLMISWFANAIETGRSAGLAQGSSLRDAIHTVLAPQQPVDEIASRQLDHEEPGS